MNRISNERGLNTFANTNMHNSANISVPSCATSVPRNKGERTRLSLPSSSLQIDLYENVLKVVYGNSVMWEENKGV